MQSTNSPRRPARQPVTPQQRQLMELVRRVRFGRIVDLVIKAGQPVLDPPPHVAREVKFAPDVCGRTMPDEVAVQERWHELFNELAAIGDGVIEVMQVVACMPHRMRARRQDGATW